MQFIAYGSVIATASPEVTQFHCAYRTGHSMIVSYGCRAKNVCISARIRIFRRYPADFPSEIYLYGYSGLRPNVNVTQKYLAAFTATQS